MTTKQLVQEALKGFGFSFDRLLPRDRISIEVFTMPESTKQFEVRYTERNSRGWKENKSEWFDVVTDAFDFAKAHRPALVYTKEGSFIGNFTFKPTTGYSGPASKPNV